MAASGAQARQAAGSRAPRLSPNDAAGAAQRSRAKFSQTYGDTAGRSGVFSHQQLAVALRQLDRDKWNQ